MALAGPHAHGVPIVQAGQALGVTGQDEDQANLALVRVVVDGGAGEQIAAGTVGSKTLAAVDQKPALSLGSFHGRVTQAGDAFQRVHLRVGYRGEDHQFLGGDLF